MRRFIVVATAVAMLSVVGTTPARAGWSAPGSGVTVESGTLTGPAPSSTGSVVSSGGSVRRAPAARGKSIEISIATQRLTAWENGRAVMHFKISTGRPGFRTPKGKFRVRAKGLRWWSRKWKVWMPYAMNFYSNYNMHSLPHAAGSKKLIGASSLGRPASHGCVRIGPADAKRLYGWAPVGTPVWIH